MQPESKTIHFYSPKDEHGYLSNFYTGAPFRLDGQFWQTSEHYFQAQKFAIPNMSPAYSEYMTLIQGANTPGIAAMLARQSTTKTRRYKWEQNTQELIDKYLALGVKIRADWDAIKDKVMYYCLESKFRANHNIRLALINTGNATLVEHTSRDHYWGDGGDGSGLNRLGELLMLVREKMAEDPTNV